MTSIPYPTCVPILADGSINPETAIAGVEFKLLKSWPDERGFFREIIRTTDQFFSAEAAPITSGYPSNFGQWSHSKMQRQVVKAWHYHHVQTDWWYCGLGSMVTSLIDNRPESPTYQKRISFFQGDSTETGEKLSEIVVKIPPGVLHGLQVISEFAHLFYVTSHTYNPNEEGRVRFDHPDIGWKWPEGVITSEKDRKDFVPTSVRKGLTA